MTAIVDARALVREYRMGEEIVHALRGVSLAVREREHVAIVGPSGCGKSTLLNLLGVIDRPTSGELSIASQRVDRLSDARATDFRLRRIGFVFQRFYLMQALTARENVELPLAEAGMGGTERRDRALELLDYVGLRKRERHRPPQAGPAAGNHGHLAVQPEPLKHSGSSPSELRGLGCQRRGAPFAQLRRDCQRRGAPSPQPPPPCAGEGEQARDRH